jgi:hypothetical protein
LTLDLPSGLLALPNLGDAMEWIDRDTYLCTVCSSVVEVPGGERPLTVIAAQSGEPNVRIVTVAGVEVHRCVLPDRPPTIRL